MINFLLGVLTGMAILVITGIVTAIHIAKKELLAKDYFSVIVYE